MVYPNGIQLTTKLAMYVYKFRDLWATKGSKTIEMTDFYYAYMWYIYNTMMSVS